MGKRIAIWCAVATMGLFGALMIGSTVQAQSNIVFTQSDVMINSWRAPDVPQWSANGESTIVDHNTVRLQGDNTSVETAALGVNVDADAEISFQYKLLDGAECVGGAPRVFLVINDINTNSWDQLQPTGEQCGTDGLVTFVAGNAGLVTTAGIVYDNGAGGAVEVSNLTVAGELVLFADQPEPTPTATATPAPEPTGTPTQAPEPTTEPTTEPTEDPADKPGLPVTGSKLGWLMAAGITLLGTGAGALVLPRLLRRFQL